jgi:LuxR family maltose regulon positive regulatory protein
VPALAIRRPRLEQLIDEAPDRHVVLVHGPAGAGKTVLVAQWLAARGSRCAWVSVDRSRDRPEAFLRRLTEAVARLAPEQAVDGSCRSTTELAHADPRDLLETIARPPGSGVDLVLDGVDRLLDSRCQDAVARLVEHPPPGTRIVLVARAKPRLGIERARLRGDLVEIGPHALRFQRPEIDALAATWTDRVADAVVLEQTTLGWAAGLRLAELAARVDEAVPPALREPDGFASEYIREELIEGSSPELASFLEVSCWLPFVTVPLSAAVAEHPGRRPPLSLPEMLALPLLPVASRPGAFRYPPVLVEALRHEYRRRDPRAAVRAQCRAAEASRRCGELVTAIQLYLQAGMVDEAAATCADLAAGGESSLVRIDDLFHHDAQLVPDCHRWLPWRIRAAVAAGRVDEAVLLLRRLPAPVPDDREVASPDDQARAMARAAVAERIGDVPTLLGCAERLVVAVRRTTRRTTVELRARGWRVRGLVWSGQMARARAEHDRLDAAGSGRPEAAAAVAMARAWIAWFEGDVRQLEEAVAIAEAAPHDDHLADLALLAGSAHREANRLAPAVVRLQEASAYAHNVVGSLAASELARCHRAAGATMEALELAVSSRAACPDLPLAVDVHLRSTEALVRLDRDDVQGAHAVVRGAQPSADAQLLAARVALRQMPAHAAELLDAAATQTARQAIEKLLLRAQLPDAEPATVAVSLMKAVATGEPLGLVRTFLDEGPAVCRLFPELALESRERALGRIAALAAQELAQAPTVAADAPIEQLTSRELAVLRMLPLRLSNREMAAQMYISVNTLKTHVRSIYRKLDVPHRSAAVRRAKALELV